MPLVFSLGKVVGAIAGVFKFKNSKNAKKRAIRFSEEFEKRFDEQFSNDSKLCVQTQLNSSEKRKDDDSKLQALVSNLMKKEKRIVSLDWFNYDLIMRQCTDAGKNHFGML